MPQNPRPGPLSRVIPALCTFGVAGLVALSPMLSRETPSAPARASLLDPALAPLAREWIEAQFPGRTSVDSGPLVSERDRRLRLGETVYRQYCAGCHGDEGYGDGPASEFLVPRPRNFRYGVDPWSPPVYKFRSTASGEAPLIGDLVRTIRGGLDGSAMPQHSLVEPRQVEAVAEYLLWLSQRSEFEQAVQIAWEDEEPDLADADEVESFYEDYVLPEAERIRQRYERPMPLTVPLEPEADAASIARGREVYLEQGCQECHGETGRGDGSSSPHLVDAWGYPIDPRDLTSGRYRAGGSGRDLYLRIRGGVAGTPMPAFTSLPEEDVWHLVHYVQSLAHDEEEAK